MGQIASRSRAKSTTSGLSIRAELTVVALTDSRNSSTGVERKLQWTSLSRDFRLRSPTSKTCLPASLWRFIDARSALNHLCLNGSREPSPQLGTYTLKITKLPWFVIRQRPSPSNASSPRGAASAEIVKPFRQKVVTPFRPSRWSPLPRLKHQNESQPSIRAPYLRPSFAMSASFIFTSWRHTMSACIWRNHAARPPWFCFKRSNVVLKPATFHETKWLVVAAAMMADDEAGVLIMREETC